MELTALESILIGINILLTIGLIKARISRIAKERKDIEIIQEKNWYKKEYEKR